MSFDELYNSWFNKGKPFEHLSPHLQNMRIFEFVQNGIHYHATFFMETKSVVVHKMKKEPWNKQPRRFSLVVDRRIYSN